MVETDAAQPDAKKGSPRTIPKAARTALKALREAIGESGQAAPASNHIPDNARVVTIDQWRDYAYRRGISTGEDRAKQQAFKRASEHLVGSGNVTIWDDLVWITE